MSATISRLRPGLRRAEDGVHLHGFPLPDSDYDLRGAPVLPLDAIFGQEVRDGTDACRNRALHAARTDGKIETTT